MKLIYFIIIVTGFLIVSEMSFRDHMKEQLKDVQYNHERIAETGTQESQNQTHSSKQESSGSGQ